MSSGLPHEFRFSFSRKEGYKRCAFSQCLCCRSIYGTLGASVHFSVNVGTTAGVIVTLNVSHIDYICTANEATVSHSNSKAISRDLCVRFVSRGSHLAWRGIDWLAKESLALSKRCGNMHNITPAAVISAFLFAPPPQMITGGEGHTHSSRLMALILLWLPYFKSDERKCELVTGRSECQTDGLALFHTATVYDTGEENFVLEHTLSTCFGIFFKYLLFSIKEAILDIIQLGM